MSKQHGVSIVMYEEDLPLKVQWAKFTGLRKGSTLSNSNEMVVKVSCMNRSSAYQATYNILLHRCSSDYDK